MQLRLGSSAGCDTGKNPEIAADPVTVRLNFDLAPRHTPGNFAISIPSTEAIEVRMPLPRIDGPQTREYSLSKSKIDEKARTVDLSFSSETPVARFYGFEILSHERGAADLSRLNAGAALLLDHDRSKQIGVVESAGIAGGKGRAVVRFSKSALGEEVFQDVKDGIRTLVSFSYEAGKVEAHPKIDGQEAFKIRQWKPLEISIVSIPADPNVGIGRAYPKGKNMPPQLEEDPPEIHEDANQREYENTMKFIANRAGFTDNELNTALVRGDSVENFRVRALEKMKRNPARPLGEAERRPELGDVPTFGPLGLTEKTIKGYSMLRALRCLSGDRRENCEELEISQDIAKRFNRPLNGIGFHVPEEVWLGRRDLTAGSFTGGGVLVGEQTMGLIDKLRSEPICVQLGAHYIPGLVGNVTWPTLTGDSTAAFYAENGDISEGTPAFGQLAMSPKRQGCLGEVSKKLQLQTSGQAEEIFKQNMLTVMAIGIDAAIIDGTGANAQPLGIMRVTGVNTVTFGTAATWAKILEFESALATDNVRLDGVGFLCSPASRAKWKQLVKFTSTASPLWDENNRVNGYPAFASNQLPSGDKCIFAKWSDVYVGEWGGPSILIDPYTKGTTGLTRIIIESWRDVAMAHPESAVISTDSAAQ